METIRQTQQHFNARLRTLTPLHIGTGAELMKGIDFIEEQQGKTLVTHRLDVDKILMELWEDSGGKPLIPSQLLHGLSSEEKSRYYLYTARGAIRASRDTSKMRECIKTPDYNPYIPGSSLKGALRTALAWAGWDERIQQPLRSSDLGERPKFAGQPLEARIFSDPKQRNKPNYDLMRALSVSDLHINNMGDGYEVLNLFVAKSTQYESPIEIEAVGKNARFRGRISIDTFLWSREAENVLKFGERATWMNDLTTRVNSHSLSLAQGLVKHFSAMKQPGAADQRDFYQWLTETIPTLADGQCVLCLGWGGGWDSKTFNTRLKADSRFFERDVIERFRLHRARTERKPGDLFPRTRRVAVKRESEAIRDVMGWVTLELKPVEPRS